MDAQFAEWLGMSGFSFASQSATLASQGFVAAGTSRLGNTTMATKLTITTSPVWRMCVDLDQTGQIGLVTKTVSPLLGKR